MIRCRMDSEIIRDALERLQANTKPPALISSVSLSRHEWQRHAQHVLAGDRLTIVHDQ